MAVLLGVPAQAYYHYVYYQSRTAPFNPIRAQFNLAALPNNTVTFYVSDSGPSIYYPNDSFGSVLGEIKQALAVWNSVSSSNLRVAFGGLESQSQAPQNTPGADVVFDDLPRPAGHGYAESSRDADSGERPQRPVRADLALDRDSDE